MSKVKNWFERLQDALDKQSLHAVANHVEALGPLTTLIQKRLRAVYGFGDVSLNARGKEIRVVVGWENEQVKPSDYFSDSQKQILMLSLFLAGRLTQTWSAFAPILMDNPVTHFDDLNAFGFVELIRGLVGTAPGRRQFFISTCEQRLFDLMLKKFSRLEGGARFYRFDSIGHDGPIVRSVGQ
jgi:exonuclease SbcC